MMNETTFELAARETTKPIRSITRAKNSGQSSNIANFAIRQDPSRHPSQTRYKI
jgi:hypothetical protein